VLKLSPRDGRARWRPRIDDAPFGRVARALQLTASKFIFGQSLPSAVILQGYWHLLARKSPRKHGRSDGRRICARLGADRRGRGAEWTRYNLDGTAPS
jgi:hypothetical protein